LGLAVRLRTSRCSGSSAWSGGGWIADEEFERAIAATSMLPGPASTELAIWCAWRLRGPLGALVGGACFILPGLAAILALAAAFLASSPPDWLRGAGAGAGAAVAAVAVRAGAGLAPPVWRRATGSQRPRLLLYALAGAAGAALVGPWLVLVLIACGVVELACRSALARTAHSHAWPLLLAAAGSTGGLGALCWTAFKVGGLSFGGGFVIVPLMQGDAVHAHHWMTSGQFVNAVALGQVTPGPVTHTVAAVGYAASGVGGGLLAALVAFAPSFAFILVGADRFDRLVRNPACPGVPRGLRTGGHRRDHRLGDTAHERAQRDLAVLRSRGRCGVAARPALGRGERAAAGRAGRRARGTRRSAVAELGANAGGRGGAVAPSWCSCPRPASWWSPCWLSRRSRRSARAPTACG